MGMPQLRGDYSRAGSDYSVEQEWARYTPQEHALYRRLYEGQAKLVPQYACPEWIRAIAKLDAAGGIPQFTHVSAKLKGAPAGRSSPCRDSSPTMCSSRTSRTGV